MSFVIGFVIGFLLVIGFLISLSVGKYLIEIDIMKKFSNLYK